MPSFMLASTGPRSYDMPHILLVQSDITELHHLGCISQGYIIISEGSHSHKVCIFLRLGVHMLMGGAAFHLG